MSKALQAPESGILYEIDFDSLVPDPDNVREDVGDISDLAESIGSVGLLSPLNVRPLVSDNGHSTWKIISGHRRHAAIGKLRAEKKWSLDRPVPAIVREDATDDSSLVAQLIENLHREDLNPIEEGQAFLRLTAVHKLAKPDLCKRVARSADYVNRRIALLKLPDLVVQQVREGRIHLEIAYSLAQLGNDAKVLSLTKNGTQVPTEAQVDGVRKEIKADVAEKAFRKWVTEMEITVQDSGDWGAIGKARLLFETSEPKTLNQFSEKVPAKAFAIITKSTWSGTAKLTIHVPLTDKEREKQATVRQAESERKQTEWEIEQADKEAKRLAALPPEIAAWEAECAATKDAHRDAVDAWVDAQSGMMTEWAKTVNAKDTARWSMMFAATFDPYNICRQLNLTDPDTSDAHEVVANYCSVSAANLTQVVAIAFATDDQLDEDGSGDAVAGLKSYLAKHGGPRPELILPPKPGDEAEVAEVEAAEADLDEAGEESQLDPADEPF